MKRWKDKLAVVALLFLTLWGLKILFQPGFYGSHDGPFMYARTAAMVDELRAGQFPVRISNTLAFGRGYPVFNYHYPLFFYLSSGLILAGLGVATSMKIVIIGATFWSVLSCYRWLKVFFETKAALAGAVLFLFVPYRFLMIFVAGNYGTVLASAFVPMILWLISELIVKERHDLWWALSLGIAALLTAHNVTALFFAPILAIYTLVLLLIYQKSWLRILAQLVIAGIFGLGLAAFFWVPAIMEMNLVRLSKVVAVSYAEHFPTLGQLIYWPWGYGYSNPGIENDGMSFMLGIGQWLVVLLAIFLVVRYKLKTLGKKQEKTERLVAVVIELFLVVIYLMTVNSTFVWESLPVMKQIQFPWRLLAVEIVLVSFLGAYVVTKFNNWLVVIALTIFLIIANRHFVLPMTPYLEPESKYSKDGFLMKGTTDIAWELAPVDVKKTPPQWPDKQRRKFYMPQWEVYVEGAKVRTYPDEDGYLAFKEKGKVEYRIVSTPIERTANAISVLSLLLLAIWGQYGNSKGAEDFG